MPRQFFSLLSSSGRLFVTGGTSTGERWPRAHNAAYGLGTETQETCTSYNLLKLARHLYYWTGDVALADYLERNQLNAVLGTQRGPGEFLYTLPLGRGVSKAARAGGTRRRPSGAAMAPRLSPSPGLARTFSSRESLPWPRRPPPPAAAPQPRKQHCCTTRTPLYTSTG
jgi:hypothetical protein